MMTSRLLAAFFQNDQVIAGFTVVRFERTADVMNLQYYHKIYLDEQYCGNGIGNQMLGTILSLPNEVGLLCSSDLVPFYESAGMHSKGKFTTPSDVNFTITTYMYSGLCVLSTDNSGDAEGLSIFI